MSKKKQTPVWIVTGNSESGDHSGPKRFNHKPAVDELKKFIEDTGEEIDVDGPGDYGSYVYLQINKL